MNGVGSEWSGKKGETLIRRGFSILLLLVCVLCGILIAYMTIQASTLGRTLDAFAKKGTLEEQWIAACRSARPSVVFVVTERKEGRKGGSSGCVISQDGLVVASLAPFEDGVTTCTVTGVDIQNRQYCVPYRVRERRAEYGIAVLEPLQKHQVPLPTLPVSREFRKGTVSLVCKEVALLYFWNPYSSYRVEGKTWNNGFAYPMTCRTYIPCVFSNRAACAQQTMSYDAVGSVVIDRNGELLGIVNSLMPVGRPKEERLTFVALLRPGWRKDRGEAKR
jgi:hypothetical protein